MPGRATDDRRYAPRRARRTSCGGRAASPSRSATARWELRWPRPPADRLEYLLEIERPRRRASSACRDPENPLRARRASSARSRVSSSRATSRRRGSRDADSPPGELRELELRARLLRTVGRRASLWSRGRHRPGAAAAAAARPRRPRVRRVLAARCACSTTSSPSASCRRCAPRCCRRRATATRRYSASTRYARALAEEWLPRCARRRRTRPKPVAMGASLGALALLHAHWHAPGRARRALPPVGQLLPPPARRARVAASAASRGSPASSRPSSAAAAEPGRDPGDAHLRHAPRRTSTTTASSRPRSQRRGWEARLVEHRDAHNWISWRDALHPHLPTSCSGPAYEARRPRRHPRLRPLGPAAARLPLPAGQPLRVGGARHDRRARAADRRRPREGLLRRLVGRAAAGSTTALPLEERARRHGAYEHWLLGHVAPWIHARLRRPARRSRSTGVVLRRLPRRRTSRSAAPTSSRSRSACPASTTSRGVGWGERGDAVYFHNPVDYVAAPARRAPRLAALAAAPRARRRARRLGGLDRRARVDASASHRSSAGRGSRTSSTSGATTPPTTGPPGARRSPTT